jgi:hypothetical protein
MYLVDGNDRTHRVKKPHGEGIKTNIFLSDLLSGLRSSNEMVVVSELSNMYGQIRNLTNDQVSSAILYGRALSGKVDNPLVYAMANVLDPDGCKSVNIMVKASGMNASEWGARLCETVTLQGMPETTPDVEELARKRTTREMDVVNIPSDDLRLAIQAILYEELDLTRYTEEDMDRLWSQRWLWCRNGGHSRNREKAEPKWKVDVPGRLYRKMAVETYKSNPIKDFNGKVYVGASIKPELGKPGRPIMSCDTVSYAAFHHLLVGVERAWRNRSVLLNPGGEGVWNICNKIRRMRERGVSVMLDYDSFDMQHSLTNQKIVIEELTQYIGYDTDKSANLIKSFDHMRIFAEGVDCGYATHSLMSGHRGTTFINSVLNCAYLRVCAGQLWSEIDSIHTGDDVYASTTSYDAIDTLLRKAKELNIRLNPMKQSIGFVGAEFLRVGIGHRACYGYAARSISRAVSGNWEVADPHDPSESLSTWSSMAWTLVNRTNNRWFAECLVPAMQSRTYLKRDVCRSILNGEKGIEYGPSRPSNSRWMGYRVIRDSDNDKREQRLVVPTNATNEYLSHHVGEVERRAIEMAGCDVKKEMVLSSYGKSDDVWTPARKVRKINLQPIGPIEMMGSVEYSRNNQWRDDPDKGVLNKYPLLMFLRRTLDKQQLRSILLMLDIQPTQNIEAQCWGVETNRNVARCMLPFSDVCRVSKYYNHRVVYCEYPVYS